MSVFTNEIIVGNEVLVDGSAHVQPVSGPLTDAQLRATAVPVAVSGSVAVSNFPATQPVSGTVAVSNFPATQPVSGPLTDAQLRATPVPVLDTPVTSSSANLSQVVLTSNTSTQLLAANAARKKVIIFAPKATLYVKFGTTASATSFTYAIVAANTSLEIDMWVGRIDALSTVNQTVNITELI
jgi:hypothetical protein